MHDTQDAMRSRLERTRDELQIKLAEARGMVSILEREIFELQIGEFKNTVLHKEGTD